MLGKINRTKSARSTLLYSEKKVIQGKAECLVAENFLKNKEDLSFWDKSDRLQMLATLNDTAEKKIAHIFLTFDHQDQITDTNIINLSRRYMDATGMGRQPYIVYRHHDAWHPHAHIVSTFVNPSGKLINTPPSLLKKLHELTHSWEKEFSLTSNSRTSIEELKQIGHKHAQVVIHGESSLMTAITSVLNTVLEQYTYKSLDEYNALLSEWNVIADRGNEGTMLYNRRGLVYTILDDNGNRVSRGIKASAFYQKPTLSYLERKFSLNASLSERSRERIETAIEWALAGKTPHWELFRDMLCREGINIVVREKDNNPKIYFIDHQEKAVFSGETLGSQYTLASLQEKIVQELEQEDATIQRHHLRLHL